MVTRAFERDSLFAIIGGPIVWVGHFLTVYVTAAIACAKGFFDEEVLGVRIVPLVGGLATVVAVALILDGAYVSWRRWRGNGEPAALPPHDQSGRDSRRRFMAFAGLLLCGASLIATVWEALPLVFFTTCQRPHTLDAALLTVAPAAPPYPTYAAAGTAGRPIPMPPPAVGAVTPAPPLTTGIPRWTLEEGSGRPGARRGVPSGDRSEQ